jgi:hypothetical protein
MMFKLVSKKETQKMSYDIPIKSDNLKFISERESQKYLTVLHNNVFSKRITKSIVWYRNGICIQY